MFGSANLPHHILSYNHTQMTKYVPMGNAAKWSALYEGDSQTHKYSLLAYSRSPVSSAKAKLCIPWSLLKKITEHVPTEQKGSSIKHFHSPVGAAPIQKLKCRRIANISLWKRILGKTQNYRETGTQKCKPADCTKQKQQGSETWRRTWHVLNSQLGEGSTPESLTGEGKTIFH